VLFAFVVLGLCFVSSVVTSKPRDWLEEQLRNDLFILCRVGCKTLNQLRALHKLLPSVSIPAMSNPANPSANVQSMHLQSIQDKSIATMEH